MTSTHYCHAILPRAGLANRLFPWARCRIFSHIKDVPMLSTAWSQLRIGPILRREADLKLYRGLFEEHAGSVGGLKKLWLLCAAQRRAEDHDVNSPSASRSARPTIIMFRGWNDYFAPLNGWDELLARELHTMTRHVWRTGAVSVPEPFLGMHVRRGDFAEASSRQDFFTGHCVRTPLSWFLESLARVRNAAGYDVPAVVVSDGTLHELEELSSARDVSVVRTRSAIGDLLLLSKARILLASGGSSFSAWASFLGQMPTLCHPGHSGMTLEFYGIRNRHGWYVGDYDPALPLSPFLADQLVQVLGAGTTGAACSAL